MRLRYLSLLLIPVMLWGCAASVDVQPMLQDFDDYEKDLRAVSTDEAAMAALESGQAKRAEAGALAEQGKSKEAVPVAEQALADARLAMEMDRMNASARRAERCRLEVEQARTGWSEAVYILRQTEEFVGTESALSAPVTETEEPAGPALPASTIDPDSDAPGMMSDVSAQWDAWREAARRNKVATADLENAYRRSMAQAQAPKVDEATLRQQTYLAHRAAQTLECRVRADLNERVCTDAARRTTELGEARAAALRATLDLERGLKENLRSELNDLRAEAKTRQDELYSALSQMEGKFASIRRDARGTIVSLADILFDFDKATLRRDVEFNLVKIATILNQFPEMNVLIEGHTDSIGPEEYNLGLSQRRAQAVHDFLVSQDVNAERLSWEGYGESRPVADNDTEENRQHNRRVDLVIQDAN